MEILNVFSQVLKKHTNTNQKQVSNEFFGETRIANE